MREQARQAALARAWQKHQAQATRLEGQTRRQHAEVDELRQNLQASRPEAVTTYLDLALDASIYPDGFPQQWRLAYVPESRQSWWSTSCRALRRAALSRPTATPAQPTQSPKQLDQSRK